MKILTVCLLFLFAVGCNNGYDPRKETEHVNNLNRDRLNAMLSGMMDRIKIYRFVHDPNIDFAALIKIHHNTAVEMAQREKEWGKNPELIRLATEMIEKESAEAEKMDNYEDTHKPTINSRSFFDKAQRLLSEGQRPQEAGNIDRVFARLMIMHHRSAIALSQLYIKYATDKPMKSTAEDIIHHHSQDISRLEQLVKSIPDSTSKF